MVSGLPVFWNKFKCLSIQFIFSRFARRDQIKICFAGVLQGLVCKCVFSNAIDNFFLPFWCYYLGIPCKVEKLIQKRFLVHPHSTFSLGGQDITVAGLGLSFPSETRNYSLFVLHESQTVGPVGRRQSSSFCFGKFLCFSSTRNGSKRHMLENVKFCFQKENLKNCFLFRSYFLIRAVKKQGMSMCVLYYLRLKGKPA